MEDRSNADMLDRLADSLQSRIDEEEAGIYSSTTLEEARTPSNLGPMEDADGHVHRTGTCGDSMEMFVRIEGDRLADVSFVTDGCGATIACGSMLTKMAEGLTVEEAMGLTAEDLVERLGGLPDENRHCASLALHTLHGAVNDARPYWERSRD